MLAYSAERFEVKSMMWKFNKFSEFCVGRQVDNVIPPRFRCDFNVFSWRTAKSKGGTGVDCIYYNHCRRRQIRHGCGMLSYKIYVLFEQHYVKSMETAFFCERTPLRLSFFNIALRNLCAFYAEPWFYARFYRLSACPCIWHKRFIGVDRICGVF